MSEFIVAAVFPYGAQELQQAYRKNLASALALGIAFMYSLLGGYWASVYWLGSEISSSLLVKPPIEIVFPPLPPPLTPPNEPLHPISPSAMKSSAGIPVPVPDAEVNPDQTIPTQQEMNAESGPVSDEAGIAVGGTLIGAPIHIQDDLPPDFRVVEKSPVIIKRVIPIWPEIARKAGIEGTVWVKLWVNKEGKIKKVVVLKSTSDIFIEPTIAAAQQFVFTPAMMQNGPVDVWVALPFHFRLK